MGWFPWSRSKAPAPPAPAASGDGTDGGGDELDLPALIARIHELARAATDVDRELIEARLADLVRDRNENPFPPAAFAQWSQGFGPVSWAQLGLLVELLEGLGAARGGYPYEVLAATLGRSTRLELELLATSRARAEELARRFAHHAELRIAGESEEQSGSLLARLDYDALLAMAEAGRTEAEKQMAELQEQISHRVRRGKW